MDLRTLDYVSKYDEHLMCPICHCPFIGPVRLQCDHVFCQKCLNSAITSFDVGLQNFPCPACRASTNGIFMNVPRLLLNMCDDIRVKCPFSEEGCKEILPRGHVQSHVDKYCEYRPIDCPEQACDKKTRKKNMSPDRRCLHGLTRCGTCGEDVMEQDFEDHTRELCPSLRTTCPGCAASVFRNSLKEHIDTCPEAVHPCSASKFGCAAKLKRVDLGFHEQNCPLITMGPFFEAQNSRIDSLDMTIRHLRQRNEILEEAVSNIPSTLVDAAQLLPEGRSVSPTRPHSRSPSQTRASDPSVDRSSGMFSYLLSLHEALREEVAGLSLALTDLDGRASMAVMNESLRIKEDMAHTNSAVNSIRMQIHWLMNPRLHQGQRAASAGPGATRGTRTLGLTSPNAGSSNAHPSGTGWRGLSDSGREGTKL